MTAEIWKDIPGYEGIYQASNFGRIKVLERYRVSSRGNRFKTPNPERIMSQYKNINTNHRWVELVDSNRRHKKFGVHVLILMTFEGPPPLPDMLCCHKDDVADNNIPSNLYWGTRKTNIEDAVRNGRMIQAKRHSSTKLNEESVIEIKKRLASGESPTEIAKDYPVSQAGVRMIQIGRNWSHVVI